MSASTLRHEESSKGQVLIPVIRAAATIGFAVSPPSFGFVVIAVSEHLIRSIMAGDDIGNRGQASCHRGCK